MQVVTDLDLKMNEQRRRPLNRSNKTVTFLYNLAEVGRKDLSQLYQHFFHFTCSFCANILSPKITTPNWDQFHQHFTHTFFVRKFVQNQTVSREKHIPTKKL